MCVCYAHSDITYTAVANTPYIRAVAGAEPELGAPSPGPLSVRQCSLLSGSCLNTGCSYFSNHRATDWGSNGDEGALYFILGSQLSPVGWGRLLSRHGRDRVEGLLGQWDGDGEGAGIRVWTVCNSAVCL